VVLQVEMMKTRIGVEVLQVALGDCCFFYFCIYHVINLLCFCPFGGASG